MDRKLGFLRFRPGLFERVWGGTQLRAVYGIDVPEGKTIGEAWLVSDHAQHESVVVEGPWKGQTLGGLMRAHGADLLGSMVQPNVHGRFPLLLKLLDAAEPLSVQVHPDDAAAQRLGEPDTGKTEMWHVLQADPGAELICGLDPSVTRAQLAQAIQDDSIERFMTRFGVSPGTSVFVPAGTIHAIGAGLVLAEIQQNSDVVYRLYDWGRVNAAGGPLRPLHVPQALEAVHFGSAPGGPAKPLSYPVRGGVCGVLSACPYFAAELLEVERLIERSTGGRSFHIVLATKGHLTVQHEDDTSAIQPGEAVLVPGHKHRFSVTGPGQLLDYYVPDIEKDVVAPLTAAGHRSEDIARFGELTPQPG